MKTPQPDAMEIYVTPRSAREKSPYRVLASSLLMALSLLIYCRNASSAQGVTYDFHGQFIITPGNTETDIEDTFQVMYPSLQSAFGTSSFPTGTCTEVETAVSFGQPVGQPKAGSCTQITFCPSTGSVLCPSSPSGLDSILVPFLEGTGGARFFFPAGSLSTTGTYSVVNGTETAGSGVLSQASGTLIVSSQSPGAIMYMGQDIRNTTQTVEVGQKVSLAAVVTSARGAAITSQIWQIEPQDLPPTTDHGAITNGKTDGTYDPSTGVEPPLVVTSNPAVSLYWYRPTVTGAPYKVKYKYTLANGVGDTLETEFTVTPAPTVSFLEFYGKPTPVACTDTNKFCDIWCKRLNSDPTFPPRCGDNQGVWMGYGNPFFLPRSADYGMAIGTTSDPAPGTFQWVQKIMSVDTKYTTIAGNTFCQHGEGLDFSYPYPSVSPQVPPVKDTIGTGRIIKFAATDVPAVQLAVAGLQRVFLFAVEHKFSAQMFLEWQSASRPSIPVPICSLPWKFTETTRDSLNKEQFHWATPTISIPSDSATTGPYRCDPSSTRYPTWTTLVKPVTSACPHP